jgi:hypothetical protein
MRGRWASLAFLLLLLGPWAAGAQEGEPDPPTGEPGESLRVSLVTIGWGDLVWERFGHNALWIEDQATGLWEAYNWGVFDFGQVDFIPRLAKGTMLYRLEVFDPLASLEEYRRANRPVWIQELALTPPQKTELLALVRWNARPENQYYRYDYYLDNCSTRIRDVLDQVLDNRISAFAARDTTTKTFRWHTRRLLGGVPAAYLGIQFVLAPKADRPITNWEEMFLPISLMEGLRQVELPGENGDTRPLVAEERVLFLSSRPPAPVGPPLAFPLFLGVGLLWAGGILWVTRSGSSGLFPRRLGVVALAGSWEILGALSGSLLLAAWLLTDHSFWYGNLNLLQVNPLLLPLPVAFLRYLFVGRFWKWATSLAGALAGLSVLGLALFFLPGVGQKNAEILALTVPLNLSAWAACIRLCRGTSAPHRVREAEAG